MTNMSRRFTRRRTILGIPAGKRHIDWGKLRRTGMAGAAAASTVAGGVRAWRRGLPPTAHALPGQVASRTRDAAGWVSRSAGRVAGSAGRLRGRIRGGDRDERPGDTAPDGAGRQADGARSPQASPTAAGAGTPDESGTKAKQT